MLRISKITDYGIVLLTYFARDREHALHTARDLAVAAHVPLPTVGKILKGLSRGGLLVSHRGVKGGYSLSRKPEEISVAEIIRVLEGPVGMTECSADAPGLCDLEPLCPIRSNWTKINQAVLRALGDLRLSDMTRPLPAFLAKASSPSATGSSGRLAGLDLAPKRN
ncbi:MAG: SUF system Fe-S cluster assembly regulator [Planctomycetales bacterium]|nr:SUF system Fe-S cluster assembly regulator [Planctomycetales bacterium]